MKQTKHPSADGYAAGAAHRGGDPWTCARCGATRVDDQIGLERSVDAYINELVLVFREARRVLTDHGTLWLNLGDSYNSYDANRGPSPSTLDGSDRPDARPDIPRGYGLTESALKPKDRLMVPARAALALQADGWFLRAEIVWRKLNPMPESVIDRPTSTHEMVYMLTKSPRYWYDLHASREPFATTRAPGVKVNETSHYGSRSQHGNTGLTKALQDVRDRLAWDDVNPDQQVLLPEFAPAPPPTMNGGAYDPPLVDGSRPHSSARRRGPDGRKKTTVQGGENSVQHRNGERWPHEGRNMRDVWEALDGVDDAARVLAEMFVEAMRSGDTGFAGTVWTIATAQLKDAHFAVFPEELVRRCLVAGCAHEVCVHCGTPRSRIVASESSWPDRAHTAQRGNIADGQRVVHAPGVTHDLDAKWRESVGWTDCVCKTPGMKLGDLELIETPTGDEGGPDTTMETGRRGLGRERDPDGGSRPITRYEQRKYAAQLRKWPRERVHGIIDSGQVTEEAFLHYIRTDRAGARPIPPEVLDDWCSRGLLERVEIPELVPVEYRPGRMLDPFCGSGTSPLVARKMGLHAVGIELKPEYAELIVRRTAQQSIFA